MMPHSAGPGKGEAASLQIDLKGALYNAVLAPSACTLAVVNLGPSEARVEMLATQFLQLERVHGLGDGEEGQQHLWDDQDQEQVRAPMPMLHGAVPSRSGPARQGSSLPMVLMVGCMVWAMGSRPAAPEGQPGSRAGADLV